MKKILVILGPTATGKTDVALNLAKKFNGELVACDSRQVYQGLDIGTGKMSGLEVKIKRGEGFWEIGGVKIWMYDVVSPKVQYSVVDYVKDAEKVIKNISDRRKLVILVGGTGLYLEALLEGLEESAPGNLLLRKELENNRVEELQKKISSLSPIIFENLNNSEKHNKRRLIRKLEILSLPQKTSISFPGLASSFKVLKIGLTAPRSLLNERIDQRVILRIDQGMIKEAEKLFKDGVSLSRMRELGLEYKFLANLLEKKITKEEFIKLLQNKIHQYAKRQMTWFKKYEPDAIWFDIFQKNWVKKLEKIASDWYN